MDTRWVLTLFPIDGGPMHVMVADEEAARDLLSAIAAGRTTDPPPVPFDLRKVPATWSCDGRDGCMVIA